MTKDEIIKELIEKGYNEDKLNEASWADLQKIYKEEKENGAAKKAALESEDKSEDNAKKEPKKSKGSKFGFCRIHGGWSCIVDDKSYSFKSGNEIKIAPNQISTYLRHDQYGITEIEAEIADKISKAYGNSKVFKKGYVYFAETKEKGVAMADEMKALAASKTGFEQITEDEIKALVKKYSSED